jgi:hypothetical protein
MRLLGLFCPLVAGSVGAEQVHEPAKYTKHFLNTVAVSGVVTSENFRVIHLWQA